MEVTYMISGLINSVFGILRILACLAACILPFIMLNKPAEKSKSANRVLCLAVVGITVISLLVSGLLNIGVLYEQLSGASLLSYIAGQILVPVSLIFVLAYPVVASLLKRESPLALLLLLPGVIQSITVIVNSLTGYAVYFTIGIGAYIPGAVAGVLLLVALVLYAVQKAKASRGLSVVAMIALPVVFIICFVLCALGSRYISMYMGLSVDAGLSSLMTFSGYVFPIPMRVLLVLLFADTVRTFGLRKPAAPAPVYPNPYNPPYNPYN